MCRLFEMYFYSKYYTERSVLLELFVGLTVLALWSNKTYTVKIQCIQIFAFLKGTGWKTASREWIQVLTNRNIVLRTFCILGGKRHFLIRIQRHAGRRGKMAWERGCDFLIPDLILKVIGDIKNLLDKIEIVFNEAQNRCN